MGQSDVYKILPDCEEDAIDLTEIMKRAGIGQGSAQKTMERLRKWKDAKVKSVPTTPRHSKYVYWRV